MHPMKQHTDDLENGNFRVPFGVPNKGCSMLDRIGDITHGFQIPPIPIHLWHYQIHTHSGINYFLLIEATQSKLDWFSEHIFHFKLMPFFALWKSNLWSCLFLGKLKPFLDRKWLGKWVTSAVSLCMHALCTRIDIFHTVVCLRLPTIMMLVCRLTFNAY